MGTSRKTLGCIKSQRMLQCRAEERRSVNIKKCPNLYRIFIKAYLSQIDDMGQGARSQMLPRITVLKLVLCIGN